MEGVRTANDYFCDYVNNSTPKERYSPDVISLTKEFRNELFQQYRKNRISYIHS